MCRFSRPASTLLLLGILLAGLVSAGCQHLAPPTGYPVAPPGYHHYEMQRFDPLPEPDTAPEIVGARPREYLEPIPEPSRARWDPRTWFRRFGF